MSDFAYLPDFVFEETLEYKTLVSEFESGVEQRRRKWAAPLRKWRLRFSNRTKADMELVRNFFSGKYGSFMAFMDEPERCRGVYGTVCRGQF